MVETAVQQGQQLSADGQYLSRRYDLTSIVQNTAERCVASYVQNRSKNPLLTYDLFGENLTNLGEEAHRQNLEQRIANCITEEVGFMDEGGLSRPERQIMGHFLPKLVGVLVLDKDAAQKIYEGDDLSPVKIALDWFMHPDDIDQTHFRVGYGGESEVYTRVPAYIAPTLNTLREVKKVFAEHTNWSLLHELHNRKTEGLDRSEAETEGNKINDWINRERKEAEEQEIPIDSQYEKVILIRAWSHFLHEAPDMETLSKRYHFTGKLPKLVVFNAANAAIEINGKDRDQTLAARDQTQRLLNEFVSCFFPELSGSLEFQNDLPWEQHDKYTQLFMFFLRDFLESQNGRVAEKNETMKQFGQHHQEASSNSSIKGIPTHLLYALLHPSFFEDPYLKDKFPRPNIMEPVTSTPRNVIWHQGEPEIEFGMYRKLITQTVSTDQFLQWLQQRHALISSGNEVLKGVTDFANALQQKTPQREFGSVLGQAINQQCKDSDLKRLLASFIKSPAFVNSKDPDLTWQSFVSRTGLEASLFTPDDLNIAIIEISSLKKRLEKFGKDQENANIVQNYVELERLAASEEMRIKYSPRQRLELTTSIGRQDPTYYRSTADGVLWPYFESTDLARYAHTSQMAEARRKRVNGTITSTINKVVPEVLQIDQFASSSLQDVQSEGFYEIYSSIDEMEQSGSGVDEIMAALRDKIIALVNRHIQQVMASTGLNFEQARVFVLNRKEEYILEPASAAGDRLGKIVKTEIAREDAALSDYRYLLASIDPDEVVAEEKYAQFQAGFAAIN